MSSQDLSLEIQRLRDLLEAHRDAETGRNSVADCVETGLRLADTLGAELEKRTEQFTRHVEELIEPRLLAHAERGWEEAREQAELNEEAGRLLAESIARFYKTVEALQKIEIMPLTAGEVGLANARHIARAALAATEIVE